MLVFLHINSFTTELWRHLTDNDSLIFIKLMGIKKINSVRISKTSNSKLDSTLKNDFGNQNFELFEQVVHNNFTSLTVTVTLFTKKCLFSLHANLVSCPTR